MEQEKSNKGVIALLVVIIVILLALLILFATGTINLKSNKVTDNSNNQANENIKSQSTVCKSEVYDSDKLKITSVENKIEKVGGCCGDTRKYNATTTITKDHNYTSTPANEELYTNDIFGSLLVLHNNKLYTTDEKEVISKYCETSEDSNYHKITCDYSKLSNNVTQEFKATNIELNLKTIGIYNNGGSGAPTPYAITNDGKIIKITQDVSNNYNECGIIYDNSEYPIDRIFSMSFYNGAEYTILLKNGTLITRDIDRDHPIEDEQQ